MNGILLIDKPKGWTSFDVVAKVRSALRAESREKREKEAQNNELNGILHLDVVQGSNENRASCTGKYGERDSQTADSAMRREPAGTSGYARQQGKVAQKIRVGHAGTLDPLASGLLIVLVGSATKKQDEFMKKDKVYEVEMKLGETSTTGDEEGQKTKISDHQPTRDELEVVLEHLKGEIMQKPHKYSAVKVNGQRAYKLAREGKTVELTARPVTIYEITEVEYSYPIVKFTAKVSSGTYIRSLVEDIGTELGTGAYMTNLRRTEVGGYNIKQAKSIEQVT